MKRAALTVAAIAAAVVVGRASVSTSETIHTEHVIEQRSVEQRIMPHTHGLDPDEVRDIVRTELAARPTHDEPPRAPADPDALARAREAVDQGLADGTWSEQDRDRMRAAIPALDQQQVDDIMSALIMKLDSGTVRIELVGPPV